MRRAAFFLLAGSALVVGTAASGSAEPSNPQGYNCIGLVYSTHPTPGVLAPSQGQSQTRDDQARKVVESCKTSVPR